MTLAWLCFGFYVVVTLWLAWLGQKKTDSLESYALGDGKMHPVVVGLALAASMTSTATFVINPGIVYAYGLSAIIGYGVAASAGLVVGIVVLTKGFRRYGTREPILTVPDWIGRRYGDRRLTVFYAAVNMLLVAMVVLICYAMAGLLQMTLGLDAIAGDWSFVVALAITIVFVFSYVFFGGTYAHAYTNTVQGVIMLFVAVALIVSGWDHIEGGLLASLKSVDPTLVGITNPGSILFRNLFEVFGANLIIGFALALQPHFLIKALYVDSDRDVNIYLTVAISVGLLFNLVLLCGLYARLDTTGDISAWLTSSGMGIDGVMPAYIKTTFSEPVGVLISIAILAAGMSTLDGILVALSAIFASDIYLALRGDRLDPEQRVAAAFAAGRYSLIGLGVIAFGLSLAQHHYKELSVAIFAQEGIYALLAATFVPVLFGIFDRPLPKQLVVGASIVALVVHFSFRYGKLTVLTDADWTNPGLTATYALIASAILPTLWQLKHRGDDAPDSSSTAPASSPSTSTTESSSA